MWTVGEHLRILKKMLCPGIEPMTFLTRQWMKTKTYCGSCHKQFPPWNLDSPVWYILRKVGVILLPSVVKHVQVFVTDNLNVFTVVCPQDDSEVEAKGKQRTQSEVDGKEGDGNSWLATVSRHSRSGVLFERVAVWRCLHHGVQQSAPATTYTDRKHGDHTDSKWIEIEKIKIRPLRNMGKVKHGEKGKGDLEEEEDHHNVEESRKWCHKSQKQLPYAPGAAYGVKQTAQANQSEHRDLGSG